jgi:hypothetical protein
VSKRANDFADLGHLTGAKCGESNELTHVKPNGILVENDSQYYLSADSNELPEQIQLARTRKLEFSGKLCRVPFCA